MTITEIYNYEVKVTDEQNGFVLDAKVRVDNNNVQTISNGSVISDGNRIASFDYWGENSLNFNVYDGSNAFQIISEILSFINAVKEDESIKNIMGDE